MRDLERSVRRNETRESRTKAKKPSSTRKKSPAASPDSSEKCDSSSSGSDTDRSRSRSSSSSSECSVGRSSPAKKSSKKKRRRYNRKHQMSDSKPVRSADMILVCLVKLLRRCYRRGRDVGGLIDHLLVMEEKTESGYYKLDCLLGYDDECRQTANEKGLKSFGNIKPATMLQFLSYDSTTAVKRQAGQSGQSTQSQGTRSVQKGFCFSFNAQHGCDNSGCGFRHVCMFCGDSNHGSTNCKKGKGAGGRPNKN